MELKSIFSRNEISIFEILSRIIVNVKIRTNGRMNALEFVAAAWPGFF